MVARVVIQDRDELWGHRANAHGPMSTPYFLAYDGSFGGGKHRLKDLCDAGYFYDPIKRYKVFTPSRIDHKVYACDERMDGHLLKRQFSKKHSQSLDRYNLHHELFLASVTASIELGALRKGWEYLFEEQLLSRASSQSREMPCHIEFDTKVTRGHEVEYIHGVSDKSLIPDAYFGINKEAGRIHFLEVDMGNERIFSADLNKKNWRSTLLKYFHIMENGRYKEHFGINSPALVLLVFSSRTMMKSVQEDLLYITKDKGKNYILFKTWTDMDDTIFIPKEINYSSH